MNSLDIIILAILAFFAVTSFFKGFVREAFSLGGVILGVIAANCFYSRFGEMLHRVIEKPEAANILAYVIIFLAVAMFMNILGKMIDGFVKLVLLKWLDRLLGVAFGLIKGLIIVSVLVLVLEMVLPQTSAFTGKSKLKPRIESLYNFLPSTVLRKIREKKEILEQAGTKAPPMPSFVKIKDASLQGTIDRYYNFNNFDGARAELNLSISKSYADTSLMDFRKFTKPKNTPDQNYEALIKGLFHEHGNRLKFVFDIFQEALPNVEDDYLLKSIICFVQSGITYKVPPREIDGVRTCGILPPAIALSEGYGDCDTKSLLFCCIASHKFDVIFLVGPTHAFVAIAGEPSKGQQFVEISGKKYILCEMSHEWPLGKIPATTQNEINNGKFYCIHMR